MLTVGSLFAGIGGFDLGFERAGMRTVWQVEQSEFCRAVLARHFPDAQRFDDVCTVGAAELEPVDIICGGFPCQDISSAGLKAGIDGARSGLWSEYARIIGELRPRYVVVENVAALLARGLGRVLGDLAALGYDAEWDCIPASAVGAPHQRDRLWLVGYAHDEGEPDGPFDAQASELPALVADTDQERRDGRAGQLGARWRPESADGRPRRQGRPDPAGAGEREPEQALQDADERALQPWRIGGRAAQAGGPEWWAVEPPVGRVAHGVPDRLDQLAALGNALVPQIAEWIGTRIIEWEGGLT